MSLEQSQLYTSSDSQETHKPPRAIFSLSATNTLLLLCGVFLGLHKKLLARQAYGLFTRQGFTNCKMPGGKHQDMHCTS